MKKEDAFMAEDSCEPETFRERDAISAQIAELSRTFLWQVDADGLFTFLSDTAESLLGYRPEELVGRVHFYDLHPDREREALKKAAFARFEGKEPFRSLGNSIRTKDGTILWFSTNAIPLFDGEGKFCGYRGTNTDITGHKMMEEKLHESEVRYSAIVENSPLGITLQDSGGVIVYANAAFARMLGVCREDIAGRSYPDLVHPDDRAESLLRIDRNLTSSDLLPLRELRLVGPDGREIVVEATGAPIVQDGRPFIMSVFQDITFRKRMELTRKVYYAVADGIATAGSLAEIVDAARRELGELMNTRNFLLAEYDEATKTLFAQPDFGSDEKELVTRWSGEKSLTGMVIRNRKAMRFSKSEIRKLADDGVIELVGARAEAWLGVPLQNRDRIFGAVIVQSYDDPAAYDDASMEILQIVANQISVYMEKKRTEEALRESEETFRTFFEQNCVGFVILDPNGKWLRFNDRFCEMTGYSRPQLENMTWADFAPQEDCERAVTPYSDAVRIGGSGLRDFEKRFIRRDGSIIDVSVSSKVLRGTDGTAIQIASIIQDITERKRFEGLLTRKAEELERHQEAIIAGMAILAEYRDRGTGEHIVRTKEYVRLLLERSGGSALYPPEHVPLLWQAAALHDIGKVGVPDMLLLKPGKLTPAEFEIVKQHTLIGSKVLQSATRILGEVSFVTYARQITEFHHEKWDGSGYPHGLEGEKIPFIARIMAIADVYDALVTERPYKKPIPHEEAVAVIAAGAGGHFDPRLVAVFLEYEREFDVIARRNA